MFYHQKLSPHQSNCLHQLKTNDNTVFWLKTLILLYWGCKQCNSVEKSLKCVIDLKKSVILLGKVGGEGVSLFPVAWSQGWAPGAWKGGRRRRWAARAMPLRLRLVIAAVLLVSCTAAPAPPDRAQRSANLSHITGTNRNIQMFLKNRYLQLLPDGTVNGTTDINSVYSKFLINFFRYFLIAYYFFVYSFFVYSMFRTINI